MVYLNDKVISASNLFFDKIRPSKEKALFYYEPNSLKFKLLTYNSEKTCVFIEKNDEFRTKTPVILVHFLHCIIVVYVFL